VCVCVRARARACARACVPACVRARACACACACVCMCACGCVCACACVRVCVRARVCVCVYLCVCHHLSHPLCHLLCRGAIQEIAPARVEQVVLEPRSVQPSERPLAVHAAVLLSCLAILLAAAGQAGPGSTESGPQGHTSPLGLITGGHFIFISQIANRNCCLWGNRSLSWQSEPLSS